MAVRAGSNLIIIYILPLYLFMTFTTLPHKWTAVRQIIRIIDHAAKWDNFIGRAWGKRDSWLAACITRINCGQWFATRPTDITFTFSHNGL